MKKGIILFVSAETFPAPEITTLACKRSDENGSLGGRHYDLNVPTEQGRLTKWPEWGAVSV
jgi:hypothetical protein